VKLFPRWLRFNAVGAMGIVVQLAALGALRGGLGLPYLAATAVAVELAVLHNFAWHERWTWKDRTGRHSGVAMRLVRFHLGNGIISLLVNLGLMRLLVGRFHIQYIAANLAAIAAGSIANFMVGEWLVFGATAAPFVSPRDTPSRIVKRRTRVEIRPTLGGASPRK
jgi:putative flippase GtrA